VQEFEVKKANAKLSELKKMYDGLLASQEALETQIASIQTRKFDTAETMAFKEKNTEVMVQLKQVGIHTNGDGGSSSKDGRNG